MADLHKIVDDALQALFVEVAKQEKLAHGDMAPEMQAEYDEIQTRLDKLVKQYVAGNQPAESGTKYYFDREYATVYFMEEQASGKYLAGIPLSSDGTFDTEESFIVELDNEEVPRRIYDRIIALLS